MNVIDEQLKAVHALSEEPVLAEPYGATEALIRIMRYGPMASYADLIDIILNRPVDGRWYNGRQLINMGMLTLTHGSARDGAGEELSFIDHSPNLALARIKSGLNKVPTAFIRMKLLDYPPTLPTETEVDASTPLTTPGAMVDGYVLATEKTHLPDDGLPGFVVLARNLFVGVFNLRGHQYKAMSALHVGDARDVFQPSLSVYFQLTDQEGKVVDPSILQIDYYPSVVEENADVVRKALDPNETFDIEVFDAAGQNQQQSDDFADDED